MAAGRTGPASRPPRRAVSARTGAGVDRAGSARPTAGRSGSARAASTRSSAARPTGPRASATAPSTAKVVRRVPAGWRGRVGGAVSNRTVRRAAVLAGIGVFLVVLLTSSVAAWLHQRGELAALQEKVATQEADVQALRTERERWNDPAYVEQQARQRLKFVRPGERAYTVLDPESGSTDGTGDGSDAGERSTLPWYESVWQSVRTADAPGAQR
ncbi:FtsB family cell division protein [Phycicoccus endophyticus]|uniref:FtsB family cell division protein n=1 Tax=Phycicoccus endophyticus TaxID=1690220 RepID=UPI001668EF39|nr:septum formation initiator family protein [Phycicoccus endophyticus]GGL35211.1 hypothetical protein GCM10012283_17040 [Phycicoccus endophyticus]